MQFRNVLVIMAMAFSLPAMTTKPPSRAKKSNKLSSIIKSKLIVPSTSIAKPKPTSTSTVEHDSTPIPAVFAETDIYADASRAFSLLVLIPDENGKTNFTASIPLELKRYSLSSGVYVDRPRVGQYDPALFSAFSQDQLDLFFVIRSKLITWDVYSPAVFLPKSYEIGHDGLRTFVFNSKIASDEPANFTTPIGSDSYEFYFLRLGGPKGENSFVIDTTTYPNPQIYYKPATFKNYGSRYKDVTLALYSTKF